MLLFGLIAPLAGLVSQAYRYRRRSTAEERAQTRILAGALMISFSVGIVFFALGLVSVVASGVAFSAETTEHLESIVLRVSPPVFVVIPIAILVAVARYRLFDIEVVLDRTIIYAPLTAALALVFLASL